MTQFWDNFTLNIWNFCSKNLLMMLRLYNFKLNIIAMMQSKSRFLALMTQYQNWSTKLDKTFEFFTIHKWAKNSSQFHWTNYWKIMKTFTAMMLMKSARPPWTIFWEIKIQMLIKRFKFWKNIHMKLKPKDAYNSWTTVKLVGYLWAILLKNNVNNFQSHLKLTFSHHQSSKMSRSSV